jgi:hypothetical protein
MVSFINSSAPITFGLLIYIHPSDLINGHAITQAVRCWLLTVEKEANAGCLQMRFVVDEVASGRVFLRINWFSLLIITDPLLHIHLSLL